MIPSWIPFCQQMIKKRVQMNYWNLFSRWFLQVSMTESGQKLVLWPFLLDWNFLYFKACFWVRKLGKMVNHGCLGCVTSFQWWKNTSILLIQFKVQLLSNWVPWKQTVCSKVYKIWPTNKIFWPFFFYGKNHGLRNQAQGHFPMHSWLLWIFKSETERLMRCLTGSIWLIV